MENFIEEQKSELESAILDMESAKENLPEQFQESGPGEVLTERIDAANAWLNEFQLISFDEYPNPKLYSEKLTGEPGVDHYAAVQSWQEDQQGIINDLAERLEL